MSAFERHGKTYIFKGQRKKIQVFPCIKSFSPCIRVLVPWFGQSQLKCSNTTLWPYSGEHPARNNSLNSGSNGTSSGWKWRGDHLGPCGHGNYKPTGSCQCCVVGPLWASLNVFYSLWALAVTIVVTGWAQRQVIHIRGSRGLCLLISLFFLTRGLGNPVCFPLGGRDFSWGMFLGSAPLRGKLRELRICYLGENKHRTWIDLQKKLRMLASFFLN